MQLLVDVTHVTYFISKYKCKQLIFIPLARASKGSSVCKTVLLGSWWACACMNTLHPSSFHFTGLPSPPGLTTRSPYSLTSVSMATPPPISKNCQPHKPHLDPSAPQIHTVSTPSSTPWDRAFCSATPRLWNSLPDYLRAPQTVECFKKWLKSFLFSRSYDL